MRAIRLQFQFLAWCYLPIMTMGTVQGEIPLVTWTTRTPRVEISPTFSRSTSTESPVFTIATGDDEGQQGWWEGIMPVDGGTTYHFQAQVRTENLLFPRRSVFCRIHWLNAQGERAEQDLPLIGTYHPADTPTTSTPELPREFPTGTPQEQWYAGTYRAPRDSTHARIELRLQWAAQARAAWSHVSLQPTPPAKPRKVRLAAVHFRPSGKTPLQNCQQFEPLLAQAAQEQVQLAVLPETLTYFGLGMRYADCAESIPGPSTEYFGGLAKKHNLYLVLGLLERDHNHIYNVAVLIGPTGEVVGKYRKVCLPRDESDGGIRPGDAYPVFDTTIGRIGMMVCYDGFFPEVARRLTEAGAEIIAFPVWGCNPLLAAARACENQVYVISSTYTDSERNWMVSAVFGHDGGQLAKATTWGTLAIADVDLSAPTRWHGLGDLREEIHRNRPPSAHEFHRAGQPPKIDSPTSSPASAPLNSLRILPKSPQESLASMHIQDDFAMQLLAAEPLVMDPVAMVYDEDGRAFVAEMCDYPYTDSTTDRPFEERTTDLPLGRIRLLEDHDHDGVFDTSTLFADGLSWPTGLAVWKKGLYVAATPDLWYLRDEDGDGRAERRQQVFSGFRKFNVQAVINNLQWGLDHQIYAAGSSNGGQIVGTNPPIVLATNDFRWRPGTNMLQPLSGGGRFGQSFDDWGNRFICNIRNPIRHAVFPDEALRHDPATLLASTMHDVAIAGDTVPVYRTSLPEPWRILNATRLASDPRSTSPRSEKVSAGYLTSACGLTIYRGHAYPRNYYGQAFLGEVAGNLIHRQRLQPQGVTFVSHRLDERVEFLTADDNWFRPVNFVNAPDGTLHVLDMYRETIEHPWSIPDQLKSLLDLRSGHDRGRIYRLTPPRFQYTPPPLLSQASTVELVSLLRHPNAWHRETAHRLIYERQDADAVHGLRHNLQHPRPPQVYPDFDAISRVLSLWSLQGLQALSDADVRAGLHDTVPEVRVQACILAATRTPLAEHELLRLATDSDLRVRFQVALALSRVPFENALNGYRQLAAQVPADPWLNAALLTSTVGHEREMLSYLGSQDSSNRVLLHDYAYQVGMSAEPAACAEVVRLALADEGRQQVGVVLGGLAEGLQRSRRRFAELPLAADVRDRLSATIHTISQRATSHDWDTELRTAAVSLARELPWQAVEPLLTQLLRSQESQAIQLASVTTCLSFPDISAARLVLAHYHQLTPAIRHVALDRLVSAPDSVPPLLEAIEVGLIGWRDLALAQQAVLLGNKEPALQARVSALADAQPDEERSQILARYRIATASPPDMQLGRRTFQRVCASCHRLRGEGTDVGPPLETVLHRSPDELVLHILDPNREVSPSFQEYVVTLHDGRIFTGIVADETATAVTLRRSGGTTDTLLRSEIDTLQTTGNSYMPPYLERIVSQEEMAGLIGYLRGQ